MNFNRDYLYEIVRNSSYPEIRNICLSNKQISSLCQNDPVIKELINRKRMIDNKTNVFLTQYLPPRWTEENTLTSQSDFAIYAATKLNDLELVDELIRR